MTRWNFVDRLTNKMKTSRNGDSRIVAISAVGVALITIGSYFPWLQPNPHYQGNLLMKVPFLSSPGIAWVHLILLLPAAGVLASLVIRGPTRGWAVTAIITGGGAVLFPLVIALDQYFNHDLYYIPDVGWVLTILGGLLLAFIGESNRLSG